MNSGKKYLNFCIITSQYCIAKYCWYNKIELLISAKRRIFLNHKKILFGNVSNVIEYRCWSPNGLKNINFISNTDDIDNDIRK